MGVQRTPEDLDKMLKDLEAALARVEANQTSRVALPKCELELLLHLGDCRDFMIDVLQSPGDRSALQDIFGGDCVRICRILAVLESAKFSEMNANDQRLLTCTSACESVVKVLEDLGLGWALRQAQEQTKEAKDDPSLVKAPKQRISEDSAAVECDHTSGTAWAMLNEMQPAPVVQPDTPNDQQWLQSELAKAEENLFHMQKRYEAQVEETREVKKRAENERNTLLSDVARGGYASEYSPHVRPLVYDLADEDADACTMYDLAADDGTDDMCLQHVLVAWTAERRAMDFDKDGDIPGALEMYKECEQELKAAAETAQTRHADDYHSLLEHRQNVLTRIDYLRGLDGTSPSIAIDQHIKAVELNMHAGASQSSCSQSLGSQTSSCETSQSTLSPAKSNSKAVVACAMIGAAGGLILGAPLAVAAGAVGGAYVATQKGVVGSAAQKVGKAATSSAEKAVQIPSKIFNSVKSGTVEADFNEAVSRGQDFERNASKRASKIEAGLAKMFGVRKTNDALEARLGSGRPSRAESS